MKVQQKISQESVIDYWRRCEHVSNHQFWPSALDDSFPDDVMWQTAIIEHGDIASLYLIASADLAAISGDSWRVDQSALNLMAGLGDDVHRQRIARIVARGWFDPRPIIVARDLTGPFTIIDGNHRAIISHSRGTLIGQSCYLGLHPSMDRFRFSIDAFI